MPTPPLGGGSGAAGVKQPWINSCVGSRRVRVVPEAPSSPTPPPVVPVQVPVQVPVPAAVVPPRCPRVSLSFLFVLNLTLHLRLLEVARQRNQHDIDVVHLIELPPLRDDFTSVLPRREGIVAVGEEQCPLSHACSSGMIDEHFASRVVCFEETVVVQRAFDAAPHGAFEARVALLAAHVR